MKKICITVDDLPGASFPQTMAADLNCLLKVNTSIVEIFKRYNCPAIGFVSPRNSDLCAIPPIPEDWLAQILGVWLAQGLELGNHSMNHLKIHEVPLQDYCADVLAGAKALEPIMAKHGQTLRYFRQPYLRSGPDPATKQQLASFLESNAYLVAPVTLDNEDWVFAQAYARAEESGDQAQQQEIVRRYLEFTGLVTDFFEELSRQLLGYEVAQTLLIHDSLMAADCLGQLLELFLERGYSFVSLDEALKDEAYSRNDSSCEAEALSWLQRWAADTPLGLIARPKEPADLLEIAGRRPGA